MLNILNLNKMTMARLPEDTNRDDKEDGMPVSIGGMAASGPKAANESGIIPVLPPVPDRTALPPYPAQRHVPTAQFVFAPNPAFTAGPLRVPAAPEPLDPVDPLNPSTTPPGEFAVVPRMPTASYSAPTPNSAQQPTPTAAKAPTSVVDKTDSLLTAFVDDEDNTPRPVDVIRLAIARRGAAHFLSIPRQTIEDSTIFSAITEDFRRGKLTEEEAFSLMSEYTDSLKPEEMFSVFMDILVAKSNGSISAEEASNYAKTLNLSDADKIILDSLYSNIINKATPVRTNSKRAEINIDDTDEVGGTSSISRLFSRRIAIVAGLAIVALGSTLGIGYKLQQKDEPAAELQAPIMPATPATPEEAQSSTFKQVAAVEKPSEKPKAPISKVVAPTIKAPKILAPKIPVATSTPETAAPKIIPRVEKQESISLPVTTKTNSEGNVVVDEAKSITSWKKLGYSVGVQTRETGKVFTLTNKEGKKVIVTAQGLQKGQSVIEIK